MGNAVRRVHRRPEDDQIAAAEMAGSVAGDAVERWRTDRQRPSHPRRKRRKKKKWRSVHDSNCWNDLCSAGVDDDDAEDNRYDDADADGAGEDTAEDDDSDGMMDDDEMGTALPGHSQPRPRSSCCCSRKISDCPHEPMMVPWWEGNADVLPPPPPPWMDVSSRQPWAGDGADDDGEAAPAPADGGADSGGCPSWSSDLSPGHLSSPPV